MESTGCLLAEHILRNYAETKGLIRCHDLFRESDVGKITAFVDEHLEGGLTVADMASAMGFGIHRFARFLRFAEGCTPYQFVQTRRVQLAKTLLKDKAIDLADIAIRLGFASQSHFTDVSERLRG